MKNLKNSEKKLTKEEMRLVKGGGGTPCTTSTDCAENCILNPNDTHGNICFNHVCTVWDCTLL